MHRVWGKAFGEGSVVSCDKAWVGRWWSWLGPKGQPGYRDVVGVGQFGLLEGGRT